MCVCVCVSLSLFAQSLKDTKREKMELKEKGNDLFKAGEYALAIEEYSKGLRTDGLGKELKVALLGNRAQCRLKLEDWKGTVRDCDEALEIDPGNLKLLFRRAQGYAQEKKYEQAVKDLRRLLQIESGNKQAMGMLAMIREKVSDLNSTWSQTLSVIDSAASEETSKADAEHKLRQVLGTIMDSEPLAKTIATKGACGKLWNLREKSDVSLKILSKMAEFSGCWKLVLDSLDVTELTDEINSDTECSPAALNILWRLLKHDDDEREALTEAAGKKGSVEVAPVPPPAVAEEIVLNSLVSALGSETEGLRRVGVEGSVRVCTGDEERAKEFVKVGGMKALQSMLSRDYKRNEPLQQVSVVLGQVLPSLKNDDMIKREAVAFCKPWIESQDVIEEIKGVAALDAIFFANKELGEALVKEDNLLEPLKRIARFGNERAQSLTAEVFSHIANTEAGRGMLAGEPTETLRLLAVSDNASVRSAAAVTLAKLNAIDFDANSEQGVFVLSSVAGLLQESATDEEHGKGVEAVSFVINDSQVKMMLCQGKGLPILEELIRLAKETPKEHFAYGLAYIFENLTISIEDLRREKIREMEVSEEQWDQFEKMTKSQTKKPGQEDPRPNVEQRLRTFVNAEGIAALRSLASQKESSDKVREAVARTLCNVACVTDTRPHMIQQGALKVLFELCDKKNTAKMQKFAAHALGKIFVTTNPNVLQDSQLMNTITPLVRQVRHSDEDLIVFECCMALTNIATVSEEVKQKIVKANAIQAFEYATYNDNLLVRRSACEALNNLVPTEEIVEWISKKEKLRLWLLFAESYEEDVQTSCACIGTLAQLAIDDRVAKALAEQEEDSLKRIVKLAALDNLDIVHRAIVCLLYLVESWPDNKGKDAIAAAGGLIVAKDIITNFPDSAPAEAAKELVKVLSL